MQNEHLTWAIVDSEAEALGAPIEARRKWRQSGRRVPYEWRLKIIESLAARSIDIPASEFDALPANPGRIAGCAGDSLERTGKAA